MSEIVVEFDYPGPYANNPEITEAADALALAEWVVADSFKELGLMYHHEYCWTDGSLYKAVVVPPGQDPKDVEAKLKAYFTKEITCTKFYHYKTGTKVDHQGRYRE